MQGPEQAWALPRAIGDMNRAERGPRPPTSQRPRGAVLSQERPAGPSAKPCWNTEETGRPQRVPCAHSCSGRAWLPAELSQPPTSPGVGVATQVISAASPSTHVLSDPETCRPVTPLSSVPPAFVGTCAAFGAQEQVTQAQWPPRAHCLLAPFTHHQARPGRGWVGSQVWSPGHRSLPHQPSCSWALLPPALCESALRLIARPPHVHLPMLSPRCSP